MLAVAGYSYVVDYLPEQQIQAQKNSQLAALLATVPEPIALGSRTQEAGCAAIGPLPDPECTPGAIFPEATKEEICVKGYSATVRNVPVSLKRQVFARFRVITDCLAVKNS